MTTSWTAGVVGHGAPLTGPIKTKRPDLCAEYGHPGCTYNPHMDKTWCLCGEAVYPGNRHTHMACCGGPLEEITNDDQQQPRKLGTP